MRHSLLASFIVGVVLAAIASAEEPRDEAINKDRKLIEGTWTIVALEVNGNKAAEEDAKKLSVINGADGKWSLRSEGNEIAKGTSTFDPTKTPKTIDFTVTDGEGLGKQFVGIYEIGETTRKLCFGPTESDRPTEFAAPSGSGYILVSFERVNTK